MFSTLADVPSAYKGLWERTLLERYSNGTLTSDRPAKVYWLQTSLWHADLRIPKERPVFDNVTSLKDCNETQLKFIAGQEAFCGITRVDGIVCTWLRLHDLRPGTALDIGRMNFQTPNLLIERGIAEDYLEHWNRTEGSTSDDATPDIQNGLYGETVLTAGRWRVELKPRKKAALNYDAYTFIDEISESELRWRASLCVSLCEKRKERWETVLSTHPWMEGKPSEVVIQA